MGLTSPRQQALLAWAASRGRDLPWRHTRDPWAILVSEVMAQQTQVGRVIPKYLAFLDRFPTPAECAAAPLADVLVLWQGLGYPRRARNLHLCAAAVAELGRFPDDLEGLLALPGVGTYTARAVLAFAFEHDVGVVDTNAGRVLARWHGRRLTPSEAQRLADEAVPPGEGWAWNQAMLDLGASLCSPRSPSCDHCPVRAGCVWRGEGDDPAVRSHGVSRPQSRFDGSDRQLRGQILRAVSGGARTVWELLDGHGDRQRMDRLVSALVAEGLLERRGDTVAFAGGLGPGAG